MFAPLWGWFADRFDYRIILRVALVVLTLAIAPVGIVSLPLPYVLRLLAGLSAAAIIPLALLSSTTFRGGGCSDQARRFTWRTAFVFLGDLLGPSLGEASSALVPRMPLLVLAAIVAALAVLTGFASLPARGGACANVSHRHAPSRLATVMLLFVTVGGGGGLAAMHVSLLVNRGAGTPTREAIAWMLSLCGLVKLAAQLFHTRVAWLVAALRRLACPTLGLLALSLFLFRHASTAAEIASLIALAGWSSASLRLVTSFWISGPVRPAGDMLGLKHAAASIGQALAPMAFAVASPKGQTAAIDGVGWLSLCLLALLPMVWRGAVRLAAPIDGTD